MKYKNNWLQAKERLTAFWNQEIIDRCCIAVTAPQNPAELLKRPTEPKDLDEQWTDAASLIVRSRYYFAHTYFAGEAFPQIFLNLGASGHAGFFKDAKHRFADNTVWFDKTLEDPDQLIYNEQSYLYQKTIELAQTFAEDSQGDYFVSIPDATGNADALSHLMGAEVLLAFMADEPDRIEKALDKTEAAYECVMAEVYRRTEKNNESGSGIGWLRTWAPGFHAQMQCDISVMISNIMFERFIMPELINQCRFLEYPLYHFDGIEQLRHLDSLLSIPQLRAIQWTQVTGQRPVTDYIPALQKIQNAGKSIVVHVSPAQIRPLMEQLSSKGLYLLIDAGSSQEADELIRLTAKLTHE